MKHNTSDHIIIMKHSILDYIIKHNTSDSDSVASIGHEWPWICALKSHDRLALEQRLLWLCRPLWEWQSLPQWLHLKMASAGGAGLSLAGAAASIIFVVIKVLFCHDKIHLFVTTKVCLSRPNYVCRNKIFLSWQKFCCGKHTFVATKDVFCCDKRHVWCDKSKLVTTNICHNKSVVMTNILLLRQAYFCRDKRCVL